MKGLYNMKDTVMVLGGIILYHIILFVLCLFWIQKFLINSFDPGVFPLLFLFLAMTIICDISLYRVQAFTRFLVRWKADEKGILCTILQAKKWRIDWNDITVFGTMGYSSTNHQGMFFLSTDYKEKYHPKKCVEVTAKRIVFEASPKLWKAVSTYMPEDIKVKLLAAIKDCCNTFYRRKPGTNLEKH